MSKDIIPIERIAQAILVHSRSEGDARFDLAVLYGVETRDTEARRCRRNADRFPPRFHVSTVREQEIDSWRYHNL